MSEFKSWYINEVDEDDIFGAGICPSCQKEGYHLECQERIGGIRNEFERNDLLLLKKYSVNGEYGVSEHNKHCFEEICQVLSERLAQQLRFDLNKVIEGGNWWFIPHGWIGVLGFLVEKDSKDIYIIGSRTNPEIKAYAYWHGIEWYSAGHGNKYTKNT